MGVIDNIKNFFGNNTETMQTGEDERNAILARDAVLTNPSIKGAPVKPVTDRYDDFVYPYSPMQKTKRYPKIINAYALEERANADVKLFINHKGLIDDLIARVTALEEYEYTERFEIRTMATRSNNFSANDSDILVQEYTIASNEEIIGVRSIYVAYEETPKPASGFRVNTFGFTVTENPTNNNKDVTLRVSVSNQSGRYYSNVYAIVYYTVYRKE